MKTILAKLCCTNPNPERVKYHSRGCHPRANDVKMENPERGDTTTIFVSPLQGLNCVGNICAGVHTPACIMPPVPGFIFLFLIFWRNCNSLNTQKKAEPIKRFGLWSFLPIVILGSPSRYSVSGRGRRYLDHWCLVCNRL